MSNVQSFASRLQIVYGPAPVEPALPDFEQGYEEGREEGLQTVLAEAYAEQERQAQVFSDAITSLSEECRARHEEWLKSLEPALAGLSTAIAGKIVGAEIKTDPSLINAWVEQALKEVMQSSAVRIRVNAPTMPEVHSAEHTIELVRDPSMPMGCVIETEAGMIDARVDSMLAEALTALREAA